MITALAFYFLVVVLGPNGPIMVTQNSFNTAVDCEMARATWAEEIGDSMQAISDGNFPVMVVQEKCTEGDAI